MTRLKWLSARSLQDQLIGLALGMVFVTALLAAPAAIKSPGVVPVVMEGFAILMLAASLFAKRWDFRADTVKSIFRSGTSVAALGLFLWSALSCFVSQNRAVSIQNAAEIGVGVLLYFVISLNLQSDANVARLTLLITLVGLSGAIIGCGEYVANPDGQTTGLFGDHQLYGSFLMILLPFAAATALSEKETNRQLLAQTTMVAIFIALLLAYARSAWLGAGVGLISMAVLAALYPLKTRYLQEIKRRPIAPALLAAAGVMFLVLIAPVSESFINRAQSLASVGKQDAWLNRQQVWHGAIKMISDHPLTGIGSAMYAYSHYPYTRLGMPAGGGHVRPTLSDQAHNLYLQTAAETGVPGAIALAAVLVTFWFTGIRRLRSIERPDRRNLLLGALGASAAFAIDALQSPSWQFGQIMILFWLTLGIGMACIRQTVTKESRRKVRMVSVPAHVRRPVEALGLLGLAALMPVAVIASTRLSRFYPSTVYAPVNGTVHHIVLTVLPDPCTEAEAARNAHIYAVAPFAQLSLPPSVSHLPAPEPDRHQKVKSGPHYRLRLEVFLRDNTGVHDGGPITLDQNVKWSVSGGSIAGKLRPLPYKPPQSGEWNYGNYADYMAYINSDEDRAVTVSAAFAGVTTSTRLDFSRESYEIVVPNESVDTRGGQRAR